MTKEKVEKINFRFPPFANVTVTRSIPSLEILLRFDSTNTILNWTLFLSFSYFKSFLFEFAL